MAYFVIAGTLIQLTNHGKHSGLEIIDLRLLLKTPPGEVGQNIVSHKLIEVVFEVVVVAGLQLGETQRGRPLLTAHALTSLDVLNVLELSQEL